ncbi:Na+/Pi-cotransporter [Bacteriovorax sp. BAL6_X]|uniref:PhoU domain-containing protein n=1 Tax=Bacteriovorax sp. BAL6_X TaxID=1201290 RepID=UPI0003858348|nr:PhoU domain-containing protein [Bacteriovorax sp. BAL6_X]EPZ51125.1 Na+/Pi-cotransporter [Bacteriovorax sp. BAL6_X]
MEYLQTILFFISGLAIFYYGQRIISAGIQSLGSTAIKHIASDIDGKNFVVNFWNGARLSLLAFSPTMANIVTVGLVNANLVRKQRVVPMLFGSAIGAVSIFLILMLAKQELALNLMAFALIIGLVFTQHFVRKLTKLLFGLAFLFLGISVMHESFVSLLTWNFVQDIVMRFVDYSLFTNLLIGFVIGCLISFILRSQTMTLAISVVMIFTRVFPASVCFSIICASTLSSFFVNFNTARKVARPLAIRLSLHPLVHYLVATFASFLLIVIIDHNVETTVGNLGLIIVGQFFVISLAILNYFFFKNIVSELIKGMYPDAKFKDRPKLKFLGERRHISSTMAYVLVELEIGKLLDIVSRMFDKCHEYIESPTKGARALAKIKDYEKIIDNIQLEINDFISKVIANGAEEVESRNAIKLMQIASDLEQLADSLDKLTTMLTKYYENWKLSADETDRLLSYFSEVQSLYQRSISVYKGQVATEEEINEVVVSTRELKRHLMTEREDFAKVHHKEDGRKHIYYSDMMTSISVVRANVREVYLLLTGVI